MSLTVGIRSRATSRESRTLSYGDDDLDPKIRDELERLNSTSEEINKLEKQLDDARQNFRLTLTESTQQLTELKKNNKRSIRKAHAYHIANDVANKALKEAQEAAHTYHRAVDIFHAAKETISCAEAATCDGEHKREFDAALQELLNHATKKLNDAEEEKTQSKIDHDEKSHAYREAQRRVEYLSRKYKSSIAKTRTYYETKASLHIRLEEIKAKVEDIKKQLTQAKMRYQEALRHLESISDSIHEKRELKISLDRGIGVGAEASIEYDEDLEISLDLLDDDSVSEAGSLDSDRVLSELEKRPLPPNPIANVTRRVSGSSEPSSTHSSMRENKTNDETKSPNVRDRGDGLSPLSTTPKSDPFDEGPLNESEDSVDGPQVDQGMHEEHQDKERNNLENIQDEQNDEKKIDLENSEESGFADVSSSEGSEIDIDELLGEGENESTQLPKITAPLPEERVPSSDVAAPPPPVVTPVKRKVLKKLIPDMDKDEIWL